MVTAAPTWDTVPSRRRARTTSTVSRSRSMGRSNGIPCSGSTCTRWLEPRPSTNRPPERWSTVAAAMAMVGALRTNTLEMAVPRRIRDVAVAHAARMANWSPPCPSATHADS